MSAEPMPKPRASHYDASFYDWQSASSRRSATIVLKHVFALLQPATVIDFGCGVGTWVGAALELGATRAVGVDGPWVDVRRLPSGVEFVTRNLEDSVRIKDRFDLAMSLEAAEHLSSARARSVVEDLCAASDVVLFGAAIPGQGGAHHVNEQWPSYWARHFDANGYRCFDILRPRIWREPEVEVWYRQNTLLYVGPNGLHRVAGQTPASNEMLDLVHPEMFARRSAENVVEGLGPRLRLRAALGLVPALLRKLR